MNYEPFEQNIRIILNFSALTFGICCFHYLLRYGIYSMMVAWVWFAWVF